jgi:hypothetical protein
MLAEHFTADVRRTERESPEARRLEMQVIYYPTFEVGNESWLKFALLYLDKLDPIIPYAGDVYLSDQFRKLTSETDLIEVHRPGYAEGHAATRDAIDQIEKILKAPERYKDIFRTANVPKAWRNAAKQTARLFEDKYTDAWERFCIENKLARTTPQGLLLAEDLANLYMTVLGHTIADARGVSPITDHPALDRFAVFTRSTDPADAAGIATAQGVIRFYLPANLSEVPVDCVIRHRNRSVFKKRQKAFHQERTSILLALRNVPQHESSQKDSAARGPTLAMIFSR